MSEYEELLAEKKRIEQRLKELKCETITIGRAKLGQRTWYGRAGKTSYNIMVKKHSCAITSECERYYTIIEEFDKKKALKYLNETIEDLESLRDRMQEAENENVKT